MKAVGIILKTLLVVVLLVALSGVILFAMGSKTFEYEATVDINGSRPDIYAHLTRPPLMAAWLPDVESVTAVDKDGKALKDKDGNPVNAGGDSPGARALVNCNANGYEFDMTSTVVESSYANYIEVNLDTDMFEANVRYELRDVQDDASAGTVRPQVTQTMKVRYKPFFRPLAVLPLGPPPEEAMESALNELKKIVESGELLAKLEEEGERYAEGHFELSQPGPDNMGSAVPPKPPGEEDDSDEDTDDEQSDDSDNDDAENRDADNDDANDLDGSNEVEATDGDDDSSDDDSNDDDSSDDDA